jgi:pre-mRNA-processing factor 40
MRADPRTTSIDDQSMRSIFDYVITKVRKREEDERRHEERDERDAMDNLRSVIKRLDPPVTLSDSWEAVRPLVEKTDEYRALKSDSLRLSVFDKYIRRLKEKESDRRDRSRRDPRDRERERDRGDRDRRDRDREYRNGRSDSHRRHRTRTRSPEHDPYAAERRQAQQDREARYRNNDSTGLSPPYRRDREREGDRYERSRQGSGDHYGRERREREVERERSYVSRGDPLSRADPRERSVSLDYGDGVGRPTSVRRRRESDESSSRRDNKVCPPTTGQHDLILTIHSALATLPVTIVSLRLQSLNQQRKRKKSVPCAPAAKKGRLRRTNCCTTDYYHPLAVTLVSRVE